ncbi:polysaccharide deacetylase family protein [Desulfovibrio sp. ZJ369]|uniref:polysaccharide deacetylase family protein n=1 Tax=Desulfovibrio sp. ZJ369 TaxID=2709793 RepID=UPI0013EB5F51|nr:polysaccharide deacetylase family protein [Desulfovibrio sp. ZJ369]
MITITTPGKYFLSEYKYIIDCIFSQWLLADYRIVVGYSGEWSFSQEGHQVTLPNIFFPEHKPEEFFQGKCLQQNLKAHYIDGSDLPFPFALPDARDLSSVDILGTAFFFLTCYEDTYSSRHTEFNGTLSPSDAFLFQNDIIHRPVVDEMLILFHNYLKKQNINIDIQHFPYTLRYSCDIDIPTFCYGRNPAITLKYIASSILKHRSLNRLATILKSYFSINEDLFFTFPWIIKELEKYDLCGCFNLKGGVTNNKFDKYYDLHSTWLKDLLRLLSTQGHELGFHPSYETPENPSAFFQEFKSVQEVSPVPIRGGRQHYLRFLGSSTWKMWDDAGLEYDSTVGFNRVSGFRTGTAREYPVFDLNKRDQLNLKERPLIIMDCTLLEYGHNTIDEAFNIAYQLSQHVRRHGGNMTLLWHNSYLETPGKRELFSQLLKYLS